MKILFIKRIYIFKKNVSLFQFKRYLQISYENIPEQNASSLIQDFDKKLKQLNKYLPLLLFQTYGKIDYLYVIEDYLEAKLRNFSIEVQIIRYWNTLEHMSEIYWKNRGKNKLLTDTKYETFKGEINAFLDRLKREDIVFPKTTLIRVKELINSKINNYPGIKDKIFEMCKRVRFNLNQYNYKERIKRMYWIRNELFHRGQPLRRLVVDYKNKYHLNNYTLRDLSRDIIVFGIIIEKIFLTLLGFMPRYLYLEEKNQKNYKLHWKPLCFSKSYNIPRIERYNHLLDRSLRLFSLDPDQHRLFQLETEKEYLSYNCKYFQLISFLCLKLLPLIDNNLRHPPFKGKLETPLGPLDLETGFRDTINGILDGRYFTYTNNEDKIKWWMNFKSSLFKSSKYLGFYLEFELLSKSTIFNEIPIAKSTSKKEIMGSFETFIIDIKDF